MHEALNLNYIQHSHMHPNQVFFFLFLFLSFFFFFCGKRYCLRFSNKVLALVQHRYLQTTLKLAVCCFHPSAAFEPGILVPTLKNGHIYVRPLSEELSRKHYLTRLFCWQGIDIWRSNMHNLSEKKINVIIWCSQKFWKYSLWKWQRFIPRSFADWWHYINKDVYS